ncbi:hypothetical protein [Algoriphagus litoralis]|uniref:hypothetical protein n=1 Tax=Algoriphagus litoralis TaxID=2202829 RepID=UPI000DB928C3|nr:hypothetical protein [Algoriphagus litoralis]
MEIDKSLVKTVIENGGSDILSNLGEITLELVTNNEAISQIPIIGTLRSLYKITNSISDRIFIQKILKFLRELHTLSFEEKEKMKRKIEKDKKNNIGENLLEIVNKIDNNNKFKIIGQIFRSYINEEIDFENLLRLSQIVNNSYLPDLMKLTFFARGQPISNPNSSALLSIGILKISEKKYIGENIFRSETELHFFEYTLNEAGKKLLYIIYPDFEIIR